MQGRQQYGQTVTEPMKHTILHFQERCPMEGFIRTGEGLPAEVAVAPERQRLRGKVTHGKNTNFLKIITNVTHGNLIAKITHTHTPSAVATRFAHEVLPRRALHKILKSEK